MITLLMTGLPSLPSEFFVVWLRWFGVVSCLIALGLWTASTVMQWEHFSPRSERISLAIGVLLFSMAYAFGDAAHRGASAGLGTIAVAVAVLALVGALAYRFHDKP